MVIATTVFYWKKYYTGNKSLIDAIQLAKYVNSRLRIGISAVKDIILEKYVSKIEWLLSTKQLTNSLTKQSACAMSRLLQNTKLQH